MLSIAFKFDRCNIETMIDSILVMTVTKPIILLTELHFKF